MNANKPLDPVIEKELSRWKDSASAITTAEEAKRYCKEPFEYSLRMVWLGRKDKLGNEHWQAYDQLSKEFLPEELAYPGASPGEVLMKGENHYQRSRQIFEKAWDIYAQSQENNPDSIFHVKSKTGIISTLYKLFHIKF